MSHYVECRPHFKDRQALLDALLAVGFAREYIEVHEQAVPLYGYRGDERPQKAHVVIRRQHVGPAANDVGWERLPDGTYRAWISEYDGRHRFDTALQNRIKQEYAFAAVAHQQRALGRSVERRMLPGGDLEVTIDGYR
ncbi:MAG: DUF1257 domain-containing protein [Armatimonadetes bacterium]|nr:DUF1257 domain-containing protein [Armatimonadota bacterium]